MNQHNFDHWVAMQLEPNYKMPASGRRNKQPSAWSERSRLMNEERERLGEEEFRRRVLEDADKARRYHEYENNL